MREYFSHDFHSRLDSKIVSMRVDWGAEGYGMYWMLVELLHEDPHHTLQCERNALAMRTQCDGDRVMQYVQDCINKYHLFVYDRETNSFTSESVLERAKVREEKSFKARKSAQSRWKDADANAMRTQCDVASDGNAIKEKKRKEKKSKLNILDCASSSTTQTPTPPTEKSPPGFRPDTELFEAHVWLSAEEHHKLVQQFTGTAVAAKVIALDAGIENKLKKYTSFKNHYATLRNWLTNDAANGKLSLPKKDIFEELKEKYAAEEAQANGN